MENEELKTCLTALQDQCNKLYESYGAIDEVMDLQVSINQLRNRFNIPDEKQMTKSNEGFVQ